MYFICLLRAMKWYFCVMLLGLFYGSVVWTSALTVHVDLIHFNIISMHSTMNAAFVSKHWDCFPFFIICNIITVNCLFHLGEYL